MDHLVQRRIAVSMPGGRRGSDEEAGLARRRSAGAPESTGSVPRHSLVPAVLVTAIALGALLWAAPGALLGTPGDALATAGRFLHNL
jgi:hypothetical protein